MYCSNCGFPDQDNKFCSSCGFELTNKSKKSAPSQSVLIPNGVADTVLATRSLVWLGVSIAWFALWVIGFTASSLQQQRVVPGLGTALFLGLFIPVVGTIYGIRALVQSQYSKQLRGQKYLITGGILGLLINLYMVGAYIAGMITSP